MNKELYWDGEVGYGFLRDIIYTFERDLENEEVSEVDKEMITDAINEAKELLDKDDDYYLYKVWFNPMGAFVFVKMVEAE